MDERNPRLDRTRMADQWIRSAVRAAGAQLLGRSRCALRPTLEDGCGAATAPTTWVAAPSASAPSLTVRVSLACATHRCWCATGGYAPYPRRGGSSVAPTCASRSNAAAPVCPTRLTSHGLDRCIDAYDAAGQGNFERALRFGLNAPRERPHCFLTALARVERSAGFYKRGLDAIARDGGLHHPDRHGRHAPRSRGARLIIVSVTPKF